MEDARPDPLGALHAAAEEFEVALPEGLLEEILQLESEPADHESARSIVQARLRALIESSAREST